MEIQKQFLRRGKDFNRSGAELKPELIGLFELKNTLPGELASNVISHQDEFITTVFHFVVDGHGNVIQSVPLNERAKFMPTFYMKGMISVLVIPASIDGSLSELQHNNLIELIKYIKEKCELREVKELNMRCFDDPEKFESFLEKIESK